MNFVKGAMLGILTGTIVGVINSSSIMEVVHKSRREIRKMKRKYMT